MTIAVLYVELHFDHDADADADAATVMIDKSSVKYYIFRDTVKQYTAS